LYYRKVAGIPELTQTSTPDIRLPPLYRYLFLRVLVLEEIPILQISNFSLFVDVLRYSGTYELK